MNDSLTETVRLGLEGYYSWELYDRPGGKVIADSGGRVKNRILNRALDQFGKRTDHGFNYAAGGMYSGWRQALAVGESNTAVADTQDQLGSEVARSTSDGGFGHPDPVYSVSGGRLYASYTMIRVINFSASFNLAELAWSESATANAQVNIRALTKDPVTNNPAVISVQTGNQLKVSHTFIVSVPWEQNGASKTFALTGVGNIDYKVSGWVANDLANSKDYVFGTVLSPATTAFARILTAANSNVMNQTGSVTDYGVDAVPQTYVDGSYKRVKQAVWTTSQGNFDHYGWALDGQSDVTIRGGLRYPLVNPASILKTDVKKLTLNFEISWARGA